MLLDGSNLDLGHIEAKIADFLASAEKVNASVHRAAEQFEIVLAKVLRLLPGNCRCRYWDLDDFWCDSISRCGDVASLGGVPNWLSGGEGCDRFRLDVSLDTDPLLYSYKFTNSATGEQVLYLGKTPDGWLVSCP
jgi:hypothetical protein